MVTLKQLQSQLEKERQRVRREEDKQALILKKEELQSQLFKLKHRKPILAGKKGVRILKKGGQFILKGAKKAAPVIKKQVRLIREQQLRDDALERQRLKQLAKQKVKPLKKIKVKKISKKPKPTSEDIGIFTPLDF